MRKISYNNQNDQSIFEECNLTLGNKKIVNITACTVSGGTRLNEDAFIVQEENGKLFCGVFDGTTSLKPIPALGNQSGARFASHFLKEEIPNLLNLNAPKTILETVNAKLLQTSEELGGKLEDTHTLPASTAILIKIDFEAHQIDLAQVGDSFCLVYYLDGSSKILTIDRNYKFDEEMFKIIKKIAHEQNITNREARTKPEVINATVEMFNKRNNNPNGMGDGLINGDPHMFLYLHTKGIDMDSVRSILLGTDGLLPVNMSIEHEKDRKQILSIIKNGGLKKLINATRESEDNDPDWDYVRYKHFDDATGVYIEFK